MKTMTNALRTILSSGFRLGTFRGIPVTVNPTVIPVALLVVFVLSSGLGGGTVGLLLGIAGALGLFASIVAHEFGHSLTARSFGIETRAITLHLFGGVAQLLGEPRTPRQEFLIAAAGPAVSLVLAAVLGAGAWLTLGVPLLATLLLNLALINLALGIFNLLPGYPMDGGRLLRAFLWQRSGSLPRATWQAARGGELVAYFLVGLGLLGSLGIVPVGGIMTMLLGWFLLQLARAEKRRALFMAGPQARAAPGTGAPGAGPQVLRGVVMGEPRRMVVIVRRGSDGRPIIVESPTPPRA